MRISRKAIKTNIIRALIFVLGVIVALAITKIWNKAMPEPLLVVKELTDSIRVIHEYNIPLEDDSLSMILEKKIKNLKLLDDYEDEINKRIKRIEKNNQNILTPNLVLVDIAKQYKYKGFTQGNASSYFTLDCPELTNNKFINFKLDFFNPEILKDIAFLRLNIYKFQNLSDKESRIYVMNEFFEIRKDNNNFIRIENNLGKGKYEIQIGFTFKSDIDKEYPTFYMKKCVRIKD